jgi:2-phosphosulfolactate phosphatase
LENQLMRKLHVVLRKEEIDEQKISHCIAVVFDVLFATSSIAAALYHGADDVIPVLNREEALSKAAELTPGSYLLAGELHGYTIDGFHQPNPLAMMENHIPGKTVIYSTTNGTVAVHRSDRARTVYTASLLNGDAVAQRILADGGNETVVLVCAGTKGNFSLEDFYGAGYLIDRLLVGPNETAGWNMTDAAKAAHGYYVNYPGTAEDCLINTRVGNFISGKGQIEAILYAAQKGLLPIVPRLVNGKLVAG